ncbi:DUF2306 domain-containing protein [Sphingomonas canadensis]|uniref:DUF2306 domain-containing protein n=1 Tax=Sphingomonas canadensis TaxID=1219257 RepID=A0ABW3H442_9SPHN|nr:DUF2306 domain-containing protein [Sphingomonas canadensis]MCW3835601.1 DUF2306 domain-containing protein [Sphingomonas canadensis]
MSLPRWLGPAFWGAVAIAALWYLAGDLWRIGAERPYSGEPREPGYLGHVVTAAPLVLIAPLQFVGALRRARPGLHRALGQVFLGAAMLSGLFAIWLGATMPHEGTQLPLMLFGLVWIGFCAIAWQAARRRDFATHRAFAIRSFAIATSFLLLHLMQDWEDRLFWFLESPELRYASRGWLAFVLPLLAAEAYLGWWPAARRVFRGPRE